MLNYGFISFWKKRRKGLKRNYTQFFILKWTCLGKLSKIFGALLFCDSLRVNLLVTASCKKKLLYQNINKIDKNMLLQFKQKKRFYIYFRFRAEKMAQRWEHSPSANVARVQISATTPYVGGVWCWFSPLLRGVYLRGLRFSHLLNRFTARKVDRVL